MQERQAGADQKSQAITPLQLANLDQANLDQVNLGKASLQGQAQQEMQRSQNQEFASV